jgi:general secretion pathway protein A
MDANSYNIGRVAPAPAAPRWPELFAGTAHWQALQAVVAAVRAGTPCCVLTGASGLGKTAVLHAAAAELADGPQRWTLLKIAHPAPPPLELQRLIAAPLGLGELAPASPDGIARRLAAEVDRRVVLLVDDAHSLPLASLLYLRLMCDLLHRKVSVLQVVLAGRPGLLEQLRHPQLAGRFVDTAAHADLRPLRADEMQDFLAFRLIAAGRALTGRCAPASLAPLVAQAQGVPRLAEQLLGPLLAAGPAPVVDRRAAPPPPRRRRRLLVAPVLLAASAGVWLVWPAPLPAVRAVALPRPQAVAAPPPVPALPAMVAAPPATPPAGPAAADAEIARLLDLADAQISADPSTPESNAKVSATFGQMMSLLGQASDEGRQVVMHMDAHFIARAERAERAGRREEARRFRFFADIGGAQPLPVVAQAPAPPARLPAPVHVSLLYDRGQPQAQDRADRLAAALRDAGLDVTGAAAADRSGAGLTVRYFFVEDRAAAADVARRLSDLTDQPASLALARRHPLPVPGAVDVLLR